MQANFKQFLQDLSLRILTNLELILAAKKILQFILAVITHVQLTAVLLLPQAIWSYAFVIRGSQFHIPSCHQFIVPSTVAIANTSETIHS